MRWRTPVRVVAVLLGLGIAMIWAYSASSRGSAVSAELRPLTASENRVLLVGDSLLWQSIDPVTSTLRAEGWDPTIAAYPATTVGGWTEQMDRLVADTRPDAVVVELGTNNCTDECPHLATVIDRLLAAVPRTTPVYWLNVQAQPTYPAHPESVNDALAAARTRWPNLSLVDMSAHYRNHPEWHQPDGLHFTTAGTQQLGLLIADALRAAR